ncbi:hypothetical protein RIF29_17250 [Crotalaria pallida]|uniref:Uncharacterized protein n=1 Tax=Crotalaria pallida TaxID=3830 RepID=A0AAN9FGR7_CROPI
MNTTTIPKQQEKKNQMVAKEDYMHHLTCTLMMMKMGTIMQTINYSTLFWLFFGLFSYVNHEGKSRI